MSEPKADGIRRVFMEIGEQPKCTKDIMTQTTATSEVDIIPSDRPKRTRRPAMYFRLLLARGLFQTEYIG